MRTDNLTSRRAKINNARDLASPSQIVVSHTRNTRRLSSLSVAVSLRSWGMLRRNERESLRSTHHAMRRSQAAEPQQRNFSVISLKTIRNSTLIMANDKRF